MRSNGTLPLTDTRRLSPQTTVSSGYHSDLSSATSTNESPQSIQDILPVTLDKSSSSQIQKKTILLCEKSPSTQKNVSRISSFLRKQYERARSKFSTKPTGSSQGPVTTVTTSSKATSTTPLSQLSDHNYNLVSKQKQQAQPSLKPHYPKHYLSSVYKQNSYTEPVGENVEFLIKIFSLISLSIRFTLSLYIQYRNRHVHLKFHPIKTTHPFTNVILINQHIVIQQ